MAIVNRTPDSFYRPGLTWDESAALGRVHAVVAEGADILDVGGESTAPGAVGVEAGVELARIEPVVAALAGDGATVSIDTTKAAVAAVALEAGAAIVNDVTALRGDPEMAALLAQHDCDVCVMHMLGEPRTMQEDPRYADVVDEVRAFLQERLEFAVGAGIAIERIMLDPGIGFGKTAEQSMIALARLHEFDMFGLPILVGASRKRFIASVSPSEPKERLAGSIAAHLIAAQRGAKIIRTHDVAETLQALRVANAIESKQ